ncbi:MAG: diaminopimelate epimerase, partial [Bacteroidota bacterium]
MKIPFTKMSGAGNDFVVVDNRGGVIQDGSAWARKVCDRRWGIGADGLLLLEKGEVGSYRMMYYNADGSYGGMCGNGGRCIARYAVLQALAPDRHQFEALGYLYSAEVVGESVCLSMKDCTEIRTDLVLPIGRRKVKAFFLNTGSPHVIIPLRGGGRNGVMLDRLDVMTLGRKIR